MTPSNKTHTIGEVLVHFDGLDPEHQLPPDVTADGESELMQDLARSRREPFRCFEGDARPHERFWTWRAAIDKDDETELDLYGYISEYSWWEDDVTPKMFKSDLERYGQGRPITIRLNSYGGDVIAASLISTMIRDYPGRVTVSIDGIAASAATVVAVAGDVVRIQDTAYFMIHDPLAVFFLAALNIEELTRLTKSLKAVKEGIINAYETRTGLSRIRLSNLMTEETWMDANMALDLGFVDEVIEAERPIPVDLGERAAVLNSLFVNVPANLLAPAPPRAEPVIEDPDPGSEDQPGPHETPSRDAAAERLRAEVQLFYRRKENEPKEIA